MVQASMTNGKLILIINYFLKKVGGSIHTPFSIRQGSVTTRGVNTATLFCKKEKPVPGQNL